MATTKRMRDKMVAIEYCNLEESLKGTDAVVVLELTVRPEVVVPLALFPVVIVEPEAEPVVDPPLTAPLVDPEPETDPLVDPVGF